MEISTLLLISGPAFIAACYLTLIFFLRLLDVFEREPIWPVVQCIFAGIISFGVTAVMMFPLGYRLSLSLEIDNFSYFIVSVLVSGLIALGVQVFASLVVAKWNHRNFDTATDYLLYFGTVGIGFEMADRLLLNSINASPNPIFDGISNGLYHTSLLNTNSIPLIMATIGLGFFLLKNDQLMPSLNSKVIGMITIFVSTGAYIVFLTGLFLATLGSSHVLTTARFSGSIISQAISGLSLSLLAGSFSFAVLYDSWIMIEFSQLLSQYIQNKNEASTESTQKKISYFSNVINHIKASNPVARRLFVKSSETANLFSALNEFGRISIKSWKSRHKDEQLFETAIELVESIEIVNM